MSIRKLYEISFLLVLVFGVLADQIPADLGLRKLEKNNNFIKVTYKNKTDYAKGFGNQFRNGIDHIKIGNEIFGVNDSLTIGANEAIEIHFNESVKSLANFFSYRSNFNTGDENIKNIISVDFTNFDSSMVEEVSSMFQGCTSIEEINFNNFQTSGKIKDMSNMFHDCTSLKEIDLSRLVIPYVENMEQIFSNCKSLKFLDLSNLNLGKLTNANSMFNSLDNLKYINIYNVKANEVFKTAIAKLNKIKGLMACQNEEIISEAINKCCPLYEEIDTCNKINNIIAKFNKNVVYPYGFGYIEHDKSPNKYRSEIYLIRYDKKVYKPDETLEIPANTEVEIYFNTALVNLTKFFYSYDDPNVEYLQSLNFAFFDSSLLESMDSAFYGCTSLESIYLTNFKAPLLKNMNSAFFHCSSLKFIDLSSIVSSSITSINRIFCGCKSLKYLVLKNLNMSNIEDAFSAFYNVKSLKYLDLFDIQTNDIFKNELLGEFGLNDTDNTVVCQNENENETLITNPNNQYICYDLYNDLKFKCANNILVYYKNESNYNKSFIFGTGEEEIESRKSIKYIYINDDIYEANSSLYIKENSYVKLCFENTPTSLDNFFNNDTDSNVINIKSIDLSHFNSSLIKSMNNTFSGCSELIALDMSNMDLENLNSTDNIFESFENLKYIYINLKNTILNNNTIITFSGELKNKTKLIPCHNNADLEVPSVCCDFDIELGRCQQTNNYIVLVLTYPLQYLMSLPNGISPGYENGFMNNKDERKSISFVNYKNSTYRYDSPLYFDPTDYQEENEVLIVEIEIHFFKPITNLSYFFSSNELNSEPIYSIDFSHFDSSLIEDTSGMFENNIYIQEINFTNFNIYSRN